jgi:hypothetical protein
MLIQRFFYGQLPDYARPNSPMMKQLLTRENRRVSPSARVLRVVIGVLLLILMPFVGYIIATNRGTISLEMPNPQDRIFLILYWPLVAVQLITRLWALAATVGVVSNEIQRGTWDTLKVTTDGAPLLLKTRWAAVFYQLLPLLVVIFIARLLFIGIALADLAQFQGHYLDLLLTGTTPFGTADVPTDTMVLLGIVTVSMMMTAALLAPFTAVAFDAALGMLLGTYARGRLLGPIGQVVLILLRVLITVAALIIGANLIGIPPQTASVLNTGDNNLQSWLSGFFLVTEGNLGLTLLHLTHVNRLWADFNYGVFIGIAALGYVLVQALLANLFVAWAGRRATRADTV